MPWEIKVVICAAAYTGLVAFFMWRCMRAANANANPATAKDPRPILRRCRLSLMEVRRDLHSLPATKMVHAISAECDQLEETIDRVEAEVAKCQ